MSDDTKNLYKRGEVWWFKIKIDKREIRESLETGDLAAARKKRDERIARLRASGGADLSWDIVVQKWTEDFTAKVNKKTKSAKTAERYITSLLQVQPLLTSYDVDQIDTKVISNLINARKKDGVKDATILRDLTAISSVLGFAEDNDWRDGGNPAVARRRKLDESNEPIVLPVERDIEAVVRACPPRFAALVHAARHTGCRQDELVRVTWSQFNDNRKTLQVIGKGNKLRTIDLNDAAFNLLRAQPRVDGSDLIFCKDDGERFLNPSTYFGKLRERASEKVGRDIEFRFHDLRHLFAVEALHNGMSIYRLQKHLGHETIAITERYLKFLSPEEEEYAKRGSVMEIPGVSSAESRHNKMHSK